jgi:hypothetical protein
LVICRRSMMGWSTLNITDQLVLYFCKIHREIGGLCWSSRGILGMKICIYIIMHRHLYWVCSSLKSNVISSTYFNMKSSQDELFVWCMTFAYVCIKSLTFIKFVSNDMVSWMFKFFWCHPPNGNKPQRDLAKFGYKTNREIKNLAIFLFFVTW